MPLLGFPTLLKQRWLNCGLGCQGYVAEAILTWRMQKVPKGRRFGRRSHAGERNGLVIDEGESVRAII